MENRKFGMRDKVGYALGDTGCNLSFSLIGSYMYPFYTQYMILPGKVYSIGILLLKIWDAINDPLMGTIIDRRRIGSGSKFKPWINIGSYGLIISAALFFLPFPGVNNVIKTVLFLGSYLVWDLCYTLVNVPYGAMNSTITADPTQRTQLSVFRSIGAGVGALMCMALPYIVYDKEDNLLGGRFFPIALIMGVMAYFCFLGVRKLTTERVAPVEVDEKVSYVTAMKAFLKNRPLLGLGFASFAYIVFFTSTSQTANNLVFQCYFHRTDLMMIGTIVSYLPMVIGIFFGTKLCTRYGKRIAAGAPFIVSVAAAAAMLFVPISPDSVWLWVAGFTVINLGSGIFTIVMWAMVSDCIDYQQYKTGVREEGSVYAVYSLFRKLAQGIGASFVAIVMEKAGYNGALGADQLPETALAIKNATVVLFLVGSVLVAASLLFIYNLGKKEVNEVTEALGLASSEIDVHEGFANRNE